MVWTGLNWFELVYGSFVQSNMQSRLKDISTPDFSTPTRIFQPHNWGWKVRGWEVWGWKVHGWKVWGWRVRGWKVHGWKIRGCKFHGWKVWGWKVLGWSLGLKSPGLKCPSTFTSTLLHCTGQGPTLTHTMLYVLFWFLPIKIADRLHWYSCIFKQAYRAAINDDARPVKITLYDHCN